MKYQVQENYLTIFLPGELDHHNAEEIRKESDHLIEHNHIRYRSGRPWKRNRRCDKSDGAVIYHQAGA